MNSLSLFFPGIWVHEFAHALACWAGGVKVHRIVVKSNSGMVVHDPSSVRNALLIGLAPLLLGSVLAFGILALAKQEWPTHVGESIVLFWIGFSIAFHSIPSHQDMQNIPAAVSRRWGELWSSPRSLLVKLGKSAVYGILFLVGWSLVGVSLLANATLLVRVAWGLGMGVIA